jgi:hypothetical protein
MPLGPGGSGRAFLTCVRRLIKYSMLTANKLKMVAGIMSAIAVALQATSLAIMGQ